ncbi:glycine--tRNA ligase subunit beta [Cognatilysobacter lacus]|uniref:Glycine--tRNA ligase beta subunit n=1 Tax=Cognatilysobacter lacus TaxID=1643323 RepID=A0A5D8YZI1_9GAMM|nr:glycine--tRNA ligase subunit beta [Lysobacter lacus]TZF88138.1 glycine--tRNA ligase subunit beta [Lysobacter lacus]
MKPLLIELGTEELPVKALSGLAQSFFDGVVAGLDRRGIAVDRSGAKPLYTPRRLAVALPGVADTQPEQKSEVLGPYVNIALDANGAPTRALDGFAQKAGVDWTQLERTADAKGERFVHRAVKPGASTASLLGEILAEAVAGMPIPKPMRWGANDFGFARPVHWLVVLLGGDVVDVELLGVSADRMSRGHRFMFDKPVWFTDPTDYVESLRTAKVLVDPDERRGRIRAEVERAARSVGGSARIEAGILEEVNGLVEWPKAVLCSFPREFLRVPQEALIATMESNQKFFPVLDSSDRLSEHFVGIANIESSDEAEVRKGYERVIRPRFADAGFFFDEDLKQGLTAMGEGLASVTYQAKLGTVADKAARIATLAEALAAEVDVDPALARRAAQVSKNDLQSRMVGEFPELQGIAGRYYALYDESLADVGDVPRYELAQALDEIYMPRFAADSIAPSKLGQVLAIAERLDTLAGGFAAGLRPTGNKDPFALRRNALGLARTLLEGGFDVNLHGLLATALDQVAFAKTFEEAKKRAAALVVAQAHGVAAATTVPVAGGASFAEAVEVTQFVYDRLRGYYAERGVTVQQFDAVLHAVHESLPDFDARLNAIREFAKLPEAEALAAANKRIGNILRKAEGEVPTAPDPSRYTEDAEHALGAAVDAAIADTDPMLERRDYAGALARLAQLRPVVDAFFDKVMVNVDDEAVRRNRLALLQRLADRLGRVAAIEYLSG